MRARATSTTHAEHAVDISTAHLDLRQATAAGIFVRRMSIRNGTGMSRIAYSGKLHVQLLIENSRYSVSSCFGHYLYIETTIPTPAFPRFAQGWTCAPPVGASLEFRHASVPRSRPRAAPRPHPPTVPRRLGLVAHWHGAGCRYLLARDAQLPAAVPDRRPHTSGHGRQIEADLTLARDYSAASRRPSTVGSASTSRAVRCSMADVSGPMPDVRSSVVSSR